MIILGINGINDIFHDASASIVIDGKIVASVEEERFNRIKHTNGVPVNAIKFCLNEAKISIQDVDMIGYYLCGDTLFKNFVAEIVSKYNININKIKHYVKVAFQIKDIIKYIRKKFDFSKDIPCHHLNHHICHAASAYFLSKFHESIILTVDGSGDEETIALFYGKNGKIFKITSFLNYPYSLGFIYTVIADFLGLGWIEGPGKLMALAAYGEPNDKLFSDIIVLKDDIKRPIEIDLSFFDYYLGGHGLSKKGERRFGVPRSPEEPFQDRHYEIAASVQYAVEKAILHLLKIIKRYYNFANNLCYAGGMALNILINRRIKESNLFSNVYIPPAAYDGGTSLGAALYLASLYEDKNILETNSFNVYLGPKIIKKEILFSITKYKKLYNFNYYELDTRDLIQKVAHDLANKRIVGWVQGRMEWGPRALGNRSILAHPGFIEIKHKLNRSIKKREFYRPYGVSILQEHAEEWFGIIDSPYMLYECSVKKNFIKNIPAVIHINNTTRPQTVRYEDNPIFYNLIKEFYKLTGLPLLLNTSFNRPGEPLVNTPEEILNNFFKTELDVVVINNFYLSK